MSLIGKNSCRPPEKIVDAGHKIVFASVTAAGKFTIRILDLDSRQHTTLPDRMACRARAGRQTAATSPPRLKTTN